MGKIFAVIDTNVLVSGLITPNASSPTKEVLNCLTEKTVTPLYNEEILQEYHEVLHREKFGLPKDKIDEILNLIRSDGVSSDRIPTEKSFIDANDMVFYEVALSKEDAYLVTGNIKHFPKVDFVVTPAEMMEIINKITF